MRHHRYTKSHTRWVACLGLAMTIGASLSTAGNAEDNSRGQAGDIERVIKWISINNAPLDLIHVKLAGEIISEKPTVTIARQGAQWKELRVQGNAAWLQDLSFTLKNVSGRRIAALIVGCRMRHPFLKYPLNFPLKSSKGVPAFLIREITTSKYLEPDEEITYSFHESGLKTIDQMLNGVGTAGEIRDIQLNLESVQFNYDTIWSDGVFSHPDPNKPRRWLPEKKEVRSEIKPHVTQIAYLTRPANLGATRQRVGATLGSGIYRVAPAETMMMPRMQSGCYSTSSREWFTCVLDYYCVSCSTYDEYVGGDMGSYYEEDQYTLCLCWDGELCAGSTPAPTLVTRRVYNPNCVV